MQPSSTFGLPTREHSRRELGAFSPSLPLKGVPVRPGGLLAELPPPSQNETGWPWTVQSAPFAEVTNAPRITIVTPSFQQGGFLEATIRSVLLQNYPNLEYIVLDGGSQDESAAILEKYRPWLSFTRSAPDRGQGHALNLGFALASGDLVGWINSDDFYLPGAFARLAQAAATTSADFFYGDGLTLDEASGRRVHEPGSWVHQRYLHFGGLILSHSAFWRLACHQPIWEQMKCNVDGELWLRLIPGRRLHYIDYPLGAVRIQPEAKTVNNRFREAWDEDDRLIWGIHGRPPGPHSWLRYEHRYIQKWVTERRRQRNASHVAEVLSACAWTEAPANR